MSEDEAAAARGRISTTTDLEAAGAAADHVIETVVEDAGLKSDELARLDAVCREDVVFASHATLATAASLAERHGKQTVLCHKEHRASSPRG